MRTVTPERRRYVRRTAGSRFEIDLLQPRAEVPASGVNVSEGGLCFRLQQALEVRSLVRLRLTPEGVSSRARSVRSSQAMECKGRVAWVIQRQDLGDAPPFYYDIGIEFVNPPAALRQFVGASGGGPERATRANSPPEAEIHGRRYVPRIERDTGHESPWHLIVLVDGTPCFSGRYGTKRAATMAWNKFRRQQARR